MSDIGSFIQFSPGAIVVERPASGGKRVGAWIEVKCAHTTKSIGGEVIAFYSAQRQRTTYRNSIGAVVRPTTYGAAYAQTDELIDVCWES